VLSRAGALYLKAFACSPGARHHSIHGAQIERSAKRLAEFVGKTRDLRHISSEDINRFLNHLRGDLDLSQKTILNHWIALSSFWTWVERDLGLPHIIRGKVDRPRSDPQPQSGGQVGTTRL
jgi:site-specific recombinase XerD